MAKTYSDDEVTPDGPSPDGGVALRASDIGLKDQFTPLGAKRGGNIDLTTRPDVANFDGSHSSVRSMSFRQSKSGPEISVPTVSDDGRIMSDDEAVRQYERTGKNFGKFKSVKDANAFGQLLHRQQAGELNTRPELTRPGKVYDDADVTVTPQASAAPEPDESPGVVGTVLNGAKQVGGAIVDTAKSIGRAGLAAVDLVSPVSKTGGLQVPFGQLADGSYRREAERGVSNVVTGGLATKLANKVSPEFAASEQLDQSKAPEARNLGEVAGSFLPSPANYAVGQATKGLGAVADKLGSTVRSDRRLLNQVTDGARAKLRTKLEKTELADNAALIRNDPSLLKSVKDPAKFEQATAERLSKNRASADAIGENVRADTNEMVRVLREKQAKLRERLDTEELADAMEKPIKKLEARAKRLEEAARAEAQGAAAPQDARPLATGKPGKYDSELERFSHEDPAGFDYLEPNGKVTDTSEQATAVGKRGPVPAESAPAEPPKGEPYRAVRQYITNRQDEAFNYMPGAKPTAKNKAAQEVADAVKEILHSKVAQTAPDALPALKRLDAESSVLARMNKIAEYKHVNSPAFNTSRLTTAMKNNRGIAATAKAGVKYVFTSADEALAAIARASKGGKVPKSMLEAARDAGVKAGTVDMLMTKIGRDDDNE